MVVNCKNEMIEDDAEINTLVLCLFRELYLYRSHSFFIINSVSFIWSNNPYKRNTLVDQTV